MGHIVGKPLLVIFENLNNLNWKLENFKTFNFFHVIFEFECLYVHMLEASPQVVWIF